MKTAVRKHLDQYVKCGMGEFDHPTNACKNEAKCVNCHKNHQSKSNQCEIWKKEKEIMKIKVTQKITYLEARKIQENQPEITFAKVVQCLNTKPETKESSTEFDEKDSVIKANSKVISPVLVPGLESRAGPGLRIGHTYPLRDVRAV